MEAVVRIMKGEQLMSVLDIPEYMRFDTVQVIVLPVPGLTKTDLTIDKPEQNGYANPELLAKFQRSWEADEFREHLKKCLAEGIHFDYDAQKLIDGTETEEERQARYRLEKSAWAEAVARKYLKEQ